MVYQDDLQVRVQQSGNDILQDVSDFFKQRAAQEFVKLLPATGNLSEAQLKAGQTGENPNASIAAGQVPASQLMNANQASQIAMPTIQNYMPILAVLTVGLVAYIALKKG